MLQVRTMQKLPVGIDHGLPRLPSRPLDRLTKAADVRLGQRHNMLIISRGHAILCCEREWVGRLFCAVLSTSAGMRSRPPARCVLMTIECMVLRPAAGVIERSRRSKYFARRTD